MGDDQDARVVRWICNECMCEGVRHPCAHDPRLIVAVTADGIVVVQQGYTEYGCNESLIRDNGARMNQWIDMSSLPGMVYLRQ